MRFNKQAKVSPVIVASLLMATIVGVFIIYVVFALSGTLEEGTADAMCGMNLQVRSLPLLGGFMPVFLCNQYETEQILDAHGWDKCSSDYQNNPQMCASHQIVKIAHRCWSMMRDIEPGYYDDDVKCLKYKVINLDKNEEIGHNELISVLFEQGPPASEGNYCDNDFEWSRYDNEVRDTLCGNDNCEAFSIAFRDISNEDVLHFSLYGKKDWACDNTIVTISYTLGRWPSGDWVN